MDSKAKIDKGLVVIIGGGVSGLTTARFLLEAGYRVNVFARDLPGDLSVEYASPWAGAIWFPAPKETPEMEHWYTQTWKYFRNMCESEPEEAVKAGVAFRSSFRMQAEPLSLTAEDYWFHKLVPDLTIMPSSALAPGMKFGVSATTFCINSPHYLSYLSTKVLSLGCTITRRTLSISPSQNFCSALKELAGDEEVLAYVNATGLGSKELVGDTAMFPTRGQTIYVKGEADRVSGAMGKTIAYVIPRVGAGYTLLGGTMDEGNWDPNATPEISARILKDCVALAPEILNVDGKFDVLSYNVGRRPSRKPGVRVEVELLEEVRVVHCYGHGGSGYELSVGTSRKVVELIEEIKLSMHVANNEEGKVKLV